MRVFNIYSMKGVGLTGQRTEWFCGNRQGVSMYPANETVNETKCHEAPVKEKGMMIKQRVVSCELQHMAVLD